MSRYILCVLVISFLACSCAEPAPWPNSRRYQAAQTEILYQAPENAAESIQAAYHPSSLLSISDDILIYADAGTRKIVRLNTKTREQTALFDFSELEYSIKASFPYQAHWGTALVRADKNWCIIADSGSAMIWFNLQTGQVEVIGNIHHPDAQIPADGVLLKNVDFELFSGLGTSQSGFYMVFGNAIYHVPWNGNSPSELLNSPLEHIAGSLDSNENADPHDAKSIILRLNYNLFTHLTERDGWLYFWEFRKLRAVRDGYIALITGDGYSSPDCTLDEFYAQALSLTPQVLQYQNHLYTPYWNSDKGLLQIDIDSIDTESDTVQGLVTVSYPNAGSMSSLALSSAGIISADFDAGSFWYVSNDKSVQSKRIFGPESSDTRKESIFNDEQSPYHPHEIISPYAISMLHDGAIALVYSPTLNLLSALDLSSNASSSIWETSFTHMITDNLNRAWFVNSGSSALYLLQLDERNKLDFSYSASFFKRTSFMGIPCSRDVLDLPEIPSISAYSEGLLLFNRDINVILDWEQNDDKVDELHSSGNAIPSEMTASKFSSQLITPMIEHWASRNQFEATILREDDNQYLIISNLTSEEQRYFNHSIGKNRMIKLAGAGTKEIQNNVKLEDSYLNDISAMTMDVYGRVIVTRAHDVYATSADGRWQNLSDECPLPADVISPEQILIHDSINSKQCIIRKNGVYQAYSSLPLKLANKEVGLSWSVLDVEQISSCSTSAIAYVRNHKLCIENTTQGVKKCRELPRDFSVSSLTCNNQSVYLSGSQNESPIVYSTELSANVNLTVWGGNGDGLLNQSTIKNAALGQKLGGMGTDGIPNLYFWMKDTCSIWKMPVYKGQEMSADRMVYRIITDKMLCDSEAFAVSFDSTVAVIHEKKLYRIEDSELIPLAQVDGEVIEMIAMGYGFVIMTTEGIFVWENGRLTHSKGKEIRIGNEIVHYAIPGNYHPRMVQSPKENAVLVPVFGGDRIIKIAL